VTVKSHLEVDELQIFADLAYADDTVYLLILLRRQYQAMFIQLFTGSCHPWLKNFVSQYEIAESGVRPQPIQSADRWQ